MQIEDLQELDKKAHWANEHIVQRLGIEKEWLKITVEILADGIILLLVSFLFYFLFKKLIIRLISGLIQRSNNTWDDHIEAKGVFKALAGLIPFFVLYTLIPIVFIEHPLIVDISGDILMVLIIILVSRTLLKVVNGVSAAFANSAKLKEKAFDSYSQIIRFVIIAITILMVFSVLLGQDFRHLLTGIGAFAAVLLLVFKDTILGFVASVQMSVNQVIKVGDWVEMPQYNADGLVQKITLTTVKVANWDNTFSTVPAYAFISDSVKNWRGMQESGCRRIKRKILIHPKTIHFLSPEELVHFEENQLLRGYFQNKTAEINAFNEAHHLIEGKDPNYRKQTNLGLFRAYLHAYLKTHPWIDEKQTMMVRQLESGAEGIPLEIYAFVKSTDWTIYENIQSDLFDHIYSILPHFKLAIFHHFSGKDDIFNAPA